MRSKAGVLTLFCSFALRQLVACRPVARSPLGVVDKFCWSAYRNESIIVHLFLSPLTFHSFAKLLHNSTGCEFCVGPQDDVADEEAVATDEAGVVEGILFF